MATRGADGGETFALAPMSGLIKALTYPLLTLPLVFVALAVTEPAMLLFAAAITLVYAGVWAWYRPKRFTVGERDFAIVFPVRRRATRLVAIKTVEVIDAAEFRRRYGWAFRFGAGGLWGGFGWLVTAKGTLAFYVSRTDGFVLITRDRDRDLLITPADTDRFVWALRMAMINPDLRPICGTARLIPQIPEATDGFDPWAVPPPNAALSGRDASP